MTWSLVLGFTLSAIIEALVRKSMIARLLPDDRPRSLATATGRWPSPAAQSMAPAPPTRPTRPPQLRTRHSSRPCSLTSAPPASRMGKIAVKVINDYGDEVMKVFTV